MTSAEEGDRVILKEDEVKDLELGCTIHFSAKFSQGGGGNIQRFWHTLYLHGPSASYFRGDRNKKVSSLPSPSIYEKGDSADRISMRAFLGVLDNKQRC